MARFTPDTAADFGRRGGQTTVKRHGRQHMSEIGKAGFEAMVQKYWNGDRAACLRRLKELGLMAIDSFPANKAWSDTHLAGAYWTYMGRSVWQKQGTF